MGNFANNLFTVLGAIGEAAIAANHFTKEEKDLIARTEQLLRDKGHREEADALREIMNTYCISSNNTTRTIETGLTPYEKQRKLEKAFEKNNFVTFKEGMTQNYGGFNVTINANEIRIHRKGYRESLNGNNVIAIIALKDFHIYNVEKTHLYAEQRSWVREEYDAQINTVEKIVSSCR